MRQGRCPGSPPGSAALAQALEELHADGDAHVPAQRDQADVARHDGRPQQVLHRGRAVGVAIENLWKEGWVVRGLEVLFYEFGVPCAEQRRLLPLQPQKTLRLARRRQILSH